MVSRYVTARRVKSLLPSPFAAMTKDEAAGRQAVTSRWSSGQTEGQVNRLKTIKRRMYGRANFDLLKPRVLYQG